MKNTRFLLWMLIFLMAFSFLQSNDTGNSDLYLTQNDLGLMTSKLEYRRGKEIKITLANNTPETLEIPMHCPDEPFDVYHYKNGEWTIIDLLTNDIACKDPELFIQPGDTTSISYKDWAYRVFGETGRYRIDVTTKVGDELKTFASNEFTVKNRKLIGNLWLNGVYRPIQNGLVYLTKVVPGHQLSLAIIFLTLILRTLLLIPSQRALRSQHKMQEVQVEIDKLKKKYKDNQERLAMETMALWKKHKVNPFGSCMMMFIQFPILIALYYVIREGLHPDKIELLYSFVANGFNFGDINPQFLGMNLFDINFFVLPFVVGGLQFLQMQLMFAKREKLAAENAAKKPAKKKKKKKEDDMPSMQDQMQMMNKMMKYVMPGMIAFFTASLPAGVGLYWGTSTLYGIFQQLVIKRDTKSNKKETEPSVRVIEKKEK